MEPVTHFLTGACVGRAGLNRKTAFATLTLTLAAEAPDIDVVAYVKGPVFGFAHHRGFTHSFLGGIFVAALVVGVVWLFSRWGWANRHLRRKPRPGDPPPRWGLLFAYAYLGVVLHILLDFTNNYGVRPFWPFWERWYSWDIVFIIEPLLYVFLLGGLILPALFGLINEEVGARRNRFPGRGGAIFALAGVLLVWGVRDFQHRRALSAMEARTYQGSDALRSSAYPVWVNPFFWYGVVETPATFVSFDVDSRTPDVDYDSELRIHPKPEETPVTLAAKQSNVGRVYLDWAKYPLTEVEELPDGKGYVVHFRDLRFGYGETGKRAALQAWVQLDPGLHPVAEGMGRRP